MRRDVQDKQSENAPYPARAGIENSGPINPDIAQPVFFLPPQYGRVEFSMGRPRTATNVLELKGAFKHDPQRFAARANEPEPHGPIGDPPDHLSEEEKACWLEVAGYCPDGVLGDSDRTHLEVVSKLLALTRRVPIEQVPDGKVARLAAMLGAMGMNPAERSKVKVPPKAPRNEFEEL